MRGHQVLAAHFQACSAKLKAEGASGQPGLPSRLCLDDQTVKFSVPGGAGLVEVVIAFLSPEQYPEGPVLLSCEGDACQLAFSHSLCLCLSCCCGTCREADHLVPAAVASLLEMHPEISCACTELLLLLLQVTTPSAHSCSTCPPSMRTRAPCSRCSAMPAARLEQARPSSASGIHPVSFTHTPALQMVCLKSHQPAWCCCLACEGAL